MRAEESALQVQCVGWFRVQYPKLGKLLFSVPNGAYLSGNARQRAMQWARLEKEGALAGVADLFLAVPSGELCGLWVEMKTPKGRQTKAQKDFGEAVTEKGYGYAVPRTIKEFQELIKNYFDGKPI